MEENKGIIGPRMELRKAIIQGRGTGRDLRSIRGAGANQGSLTQKHLGLAGSLLCVLMFPKGDREET